MVNTAMIRALLEREKMTQEQLGDLLGVSRQSQHSNRSIRRHCPRQDDDNFLPKLLTQTQ